MMDQGLHRLLHLAARRRHDLAVAARNRTPGQRIQASPHDPHRLADIFGPDHQPILAVSAGAYRRIEFHAVVDIIGLAPPFVRRRVRLILQPFKLCDSLD